MYCRYCGEPIDPGTLKCTSCGRENGPLTNGSSFWDVAGRKGEPVKLKENDGAAQEKVYEAVPVPPAVPVPKYDPTSASKKIGNEKGRKHSPLPMVLQAACLLAALAVLVLLLVLIGKLNRISSQNDEIKNKIEAASKAPAAVSVDWEEQARSIVKEEKQSLQEGIKSLQDKVAELESKIGNSDVTLPSDALKEVMDELDEVEWKLAHMESQLDEINNKIPETTEALPEETEAPTEEWETTVYVEETSSYEGENPPDEGETPSEETEATSEEGGFTLPWSWPYP